jgi:hypothetical protein
MIGMDMTFEYVLYIEVVLTNVGNDGVVVCVGSAAGGWVVVKDGIEN